jgi:hypothetical protein
MYMGNAFYRYMDEAIYMYIVLSTNSEIHLLVERGAAAYH